jgi:formate hydrogenlyase subunit 3/multisubunit Na+/H+ antiporter MnhD subunit
MSILPLLPILILLGAALFVALNRVRRLQIPNALMAAGLLAALVAMLPLAGQPPHEVLVSGWRPISVFGTPIGLRVEALPWLLSVIVLAVGSAHALSAVAYSDTHSNISRGLTLAAIAAFVVSTFSANLLTLAIAWGIFDILLAIAHLLNTPGEQARRMAFVFGFNFAATACVWIAALSIIQAHHSQYWHLMRLPDVAAGLLVLAAILRLGLYPLNSWLMLGDRDSFRRTALLHMLSPLAGFYLLIRVAGLNIAPRGDVLVALSALSILIGGWLAWWKSARGEARPYIALSLLGTIMLGSTHVVIPGNTSAHVVTSGALAWAFAVTALSIGRSFDTRTPWWVVAYAVVFAMLIGLPGTLSYAVRANLLAGLSASENWGVIGVTFLGETLTFAALIRMAITPAKDDAPSRRFTLLAGIISYAVALIPPFLLTAIARQGIPQLTPPAPQSLLAALGPLGGVLIVLPVVLAIAIDRLLPRQPTQSSFAIIATSVLGLNWLYWLITMFGNALANILGNLAQLLEGEGALLWALLIVVVALVIGSGVS